MKLIDALDCDSQGNLTQRISINPDHITKVYKDYRDLEGHLSIQLCSGDVYWYKGNESELLVDCNY